MAQDARVVVKHLDEDIAPEPTQPLALLEHDDSTVGGSVIALLARTGDAYNPCHYGLHDGLRNGPFNRGGRCPLGLLAGRRRVLLVFVHPGCELCAALARELPRWRERTVKELTIAVITNGSVEENIAWRSEQQLGDITLMVQESNEASLRYRIRGTPSAVLVDADGRIAAAVARGAIAIRELLTTARAPARSR